jgi:4-amino-4-deoxy-L-arabinose transferase-like glycosyltransferase
VRDLLRQSRRWFVLAALAGLALRVIFLVFFPSITSDSFIYGDIAKNWLQHGVFGISGNGGITPTDIRLPGYPAFLAAIFGIFGSEHYRAVMLVQIAVDLGTCFLVSALALQILNTRAAKAAFLLTALCPFLANYSVAVLSETLEIFFTVLALYLAFLGFKETGQLWYWIGCGCAVAAAILLRPDGGLLLVVIAAYLLGIGVQKYRSHRPFVAELLAVVLLGLFALAPLVPWTMRNFYAFHRFQPLAPRYANQEGEFVPLGFNRWVGTWMAEFVSTEEIYWSVPGDTIDAAQLPSRAFDSAEQREVTLQLIDDYNHALHLSPALDARFAELADERIAGHRFRYYVELPFLRIADMWLRPRTELLPSDTRWWEFNDDPRWLTLAIVLGVVNLIYIVTGLTGLVRAEFAFPAGLLLAFVLLRSLFLTTLENPEPRYTLECYPIVILWASGLFAWTMTASHSKN